MLQYHSVAVFKCLDLLVMRRKIFIVLTIIWMVVIFAFSAKNAEESGQESGRLGLTIGGLIVSNFDELSDEEKLAFAEKIDHPIRKAAHATEYAILGFLATGAVYTLSFKWYVNGLISWGIATLYAASDEIHQLFVPGRSGEFKDVCIDSAGALVGVIIGAAIFSAYYRRKQKAVPQG